jgi:hypothetical protein
MRISVIGLVVVLALVPLACGGGSGPTVNVRPADFWVDANTGSDTFDGSQNTPWKTITHALATAGQNVLIQVNPGIYDAVNGETFPLQMQAGQELRGDEANRGLGATATQIVGEAAVGGGQYRTLLLAADCKLSGFRFAGTSQITGHHAVLAGGIMFEVFLNTFGPATYSGVRVNGPDTGQGMAIIRHNTFNTEAYGCYLQWDPAPLDIFSNQFNASALPIDINANAGSTIRGNTIIGSGQLGIQLAGPHTVRGNTFNNPTGYALYGAIRCWSGAFTTPTVRNNTFICVKGILIDAGTPDLGTAADPGGNSFAGVTGLCVEQATTTTVMALGNTWPVPVPQCGTHIDTSGGGTVIWGSATGEQCP